MGLKLIQQYGAGLEGVDRVAAAELEVPVMNIPTVEGNAVSTAELAVFLLLSILRRANEMSAVLDGRGLGSPVGATIHGKRILVPCALQFHLFLAPVFSHTTTFQPLLTMCSQTPASAD